MDALPDVIVHRDAQLAGLNLRRAAAHQGDRIGVIDRAQDFLDQLRLAGFAQQIEVFVILDTATAVGAGTALPQQTIGGFG